MVRLIWIAMIWVIFALMPLHSTQACPACKDVIEQAVDEKGHRATKPGQLSPTEWAYSISVLFLLVIPMGVGCVGTKYIIDIIAKENRMP